MASFLPTGNFVARGPENVDPRLVAILKQAAEQFVQQNPGYRVEAYSGFRPGDKRQHGKGHAVDLRIVDVKTGKALSNYQTPETFRVYEKFAHTARGVQQKVAPDLDKAFRWGGYFSGGKGKYGAMDLMHFDVGGGNGLGMAGGTWDGGLTAAQRKRWPGVQSFGIGQGGDTAVAMLPQALPGKFPQAPIPAERPRGLARLAPNGLTTAPTQVLAGAPTTLADDPIGSVLASATNPVPAPLRNLAPQTPANRPQPALPPLGAPREIATLPATPVQTSIPTPAPITPGLAPQPSAPPMASAGAGLGSIFSGLVSALASSSAASAQAQAEADRQWKASYAKTLGPDPMLAINEVPREFAGSLNTNPVPVSTRPAVDPASASTMPTADEILLELFGQPKKDNRLAMLPGMYA